MKTAMKKSTIILIAVGAVLAILLIWGIASYNGLVSAEEKASEKLSTIDVRLTERANKIPNLVNSAKLYMNHENEIFDKITEARKALSTASSIEDKLTADQQLNTAVNQLLAVMESNPEIKADKAVTALMDEVSGAENKISVARTDYNEAVKEYNASVRRFPSNIIAGMFGFEKMEMYEATDSDRVTPVVPVE